MKKIAILLLVSIFALSFTVCGQATAEDSAVRSKPIKIGVSFATLQEERWQADWRIMEEVAAELGVEIVAQSANGDENLQNSQCENMITQGIDVLAIVPQNGGTMAPVVKSAKEAGIPVIAYDRLITNCDLNLYITFDCYDVGVHQAQYAVERAPKGNYFLIGGSPTDNNALLMRNGQMEVLQPYIDRGDIKIVVDQWATGWNPELVVPFVENGLTANNNDVAAVLTCNDACAGAAIQALNEQGLAQDVIVTGLDADLSACQRIMEGTQNMTCYRRFFVLDRMTVEAAVAIAEGKDLKQMYNTTTVNNGAMDVLTVFMVNGVDMFPVDKENMNVIWEDGWLAKEDVLKNIPQDQWPQ